MNIQPKLKTERLEIRLEPAQKVLLKDRAEKAKLTLTDYIIRELGL